MSEPQRSEATGSGTGAPETSGGLDAAAELKPPRAPLQRKDLIAIEPLEVDEILRILDTAEGLKEISRRPIKKVPALRGKTIVNLFVEPSTRTRTSFEIAGKRLSADTQSLSVSASSMVKGETLLDTARNLESYRPDLIVVRHPAAGAAEMLARICRAGVVNAGDGAHEHPTQALLDALTIRDHKGGFDGLRVAIVGDIARSRVARSNIHCLRKLGARVVVAGPPTLMPVGVESLGVEAHRRLEPAVEGADVVMMLRIQVERGDRPAFPSQLEYFNLFGLTRERLALAAPDAIVMHPGPMNRGVEIASDVADGPASVILDQAANGLAVRMAILYLLVGGASGDEEAAA